MFDTSIILYNGENLTKHGGKFIRCNGCQQLFLKYDDLSNFECQFCKM